MKTKTRKLGVIGMGEGRSVLAACRTSEHWEAAGICDLDQALCRARCEEFGLDPSIIRGDYADLLADDRLDAIAIYTPDPLHARHTREALEAGKHVICTKPLFPGLEEAASVLEAARRAGRRVLVGQSTRFGEPMLQQRADFDTGKLGDLLSVEAHYVHDHRSYMRKDWTRGGGIDWVFGGLSHPLDLVRWYLRDIEEVFGYGTQSPASRKAGHTGNDTLHCVLAAASGAVARVSGVYGAPELPATAERLVSCNLRGTAGSSQANYPQLDYFLNEGEDGKPYWQTHQTNTERHAYYYRFEGFQHHAGEFQNYLDQFARALDEDRVASPDLVEGIGTVAVMAALRRSIETRQPVRPANLLAEHGLPKTPPGGGKW